MTRPTTTPSSPLERASQATLLDALRGRRSRRFAKGMQLDSGPLRYESQYTPEPLTLEEEAALAFAGAGITGYVLGELPYGQDGTSSGGNIMVHFVGRATATADGVHNVALIVSNDEGTWLLRRPQDFPRYELPALIEAAQRGDLVDLYLKSRVRLSDGRCEVPHQIPTVPPFNFWSANVPGTTYFLAVNELSALYINVCLSAFSEEFGYFNLDDRNNFRPSGLARFARSRGGHLYDNPADGRILTISVGETTLCEFAAWEQGGMMQNLGLMAEALGLGGFPHFAVDGPTWFRALGFRMEEIPFSRTIGANPALRLLLRALKRDVPMPTAVGLEREGEPLLKPFCPPYYKNMEEAVRAYVDYKFAPHTGTMRDGGTTTAWRDGAAVQAEIPPYSERAVEATIAFCDYVYNRYGRFPALCGPFRTLLAYQAHHVDPDFYNRFYK